MYIPGRMPSEKSLVAWLRTLRPYEQKSMGVPIEAGAKMIRAILREGPSARKAMEKVDDLLRFNGVEHLASGDPYSTRTPQLQFYYLNRGDTYDTTLVRINGNFDLRSWGDIVEAAERRGIKFR